MGVIDASEEHLTAIAAIYDAAAHEGPATFDLEGPPVDSWREVLALDEELLVFVDDGGEVCGYAKTAWFKERAAYSVTREVSAYVGERYRGRGVGRALYTELLRRLDVSPGLRLAVAGVTLPNEASERLHRSAGFREVGTFEGIGEKFGRAWSVRWYQRPLGRQATGSGSS